MKRGKKKVVKQAKKSNVLKFNPKRRATTAATPKPRVLWPSSLAGPLTQLQDVASELSGGAGALVVDSQETLSAANQLLTDVANARVRYAQLRAQTLEPIEDRVRTIDNFHFAPTRRSLDSADDQLHAKVLAFLAAGDTPVVA